MQTRSSDSTWRFLPAGKLEEYADNWNFVASSVSSDHPLLRTEFLVPLVRHFGTPQTILAIKGASEASLWGGAALLEQQSLGRTASFCPPQLPLCPIVGSAFQRSARELLKRNTRAVLSLLRFDPKYQGSEGEYQSLLESNEYASTIAIDCDAVSFDSYWSDRSKSLRKNLRRYRNRVDTEYGASRYHVIRDATEIAAGTRRYANIESKGWKGGEGTALEPDSKQTEFYTECLTRFAQKSGGSVHELYFGDHLVASRLCIQSNRILVILKTTYDEEYSDFAPGRLLLHELLRSCFADQGVGVVEFYTKANSDQRAWATESRSILDLTFYRNRGVKMILSAKKALTVATGRGRLT